MLLAFICREGGLTLLVSAVCFEVGWSAAISRDPVTHQLPPSANSTQPRRETYKRVDRRSVPGIQLLIDAAILPPQT